MATTAVDPVFVDANILVYSTVPASPFHTQAVKALADLRAAGTVLHTSRQILREYIAVLSSRFVPPVPMPTILADVRRFLAAFSILEDGPAVTTELLTLLPTVTLGGQQVHDANVVATMAAHGVRRLLTNNVADFTRFASVIAIEPLVP
ncbi:MAG TPA: PIN domain-containing protein [Gemmataceae bacterium]|nr:PIN domain-containing protein [Gemmataceae bacterium]